MNLDNIHKMFFIGIGGIGMSALARYFKQRGVQVSGYDRTETSLTKTLIEEGISITYQDTLEEIQKEFIAPNDHLLVVYTPAVKDDTFLLRHFQQDAFQMVKRAELLGEVSKNMFTIAVAGTHGKTTTSSMIAHILKTADFSCTAFMGGIATNYNSNVLIGQGNFLVVEADEYDRSFLQLNPDISVITYTSPDHLDIYNTPEEMTATFNEFASRVKKKGTLILSSHSQIKVPENVKSLTYSLEKDTQVRTFNLRVEQESYHFDLASPLFNIFDIESNIGGRHNIENAVAAITVAQIMGIEEDIIKLAMASYAGVKRRFEYIVRNNKVVFIDDYAHHPEEITACISAVRDLYPDKKLLGVFQPHLFSRTKDFAQGFGESLSNCDDLVLLDIYPAREKPMEGVNSELILSYCKAQKKQVLKKEDLVDYIVQNEEGLVLTMGAGDIDKLISPIREALLS